MCKLACCQHWWLLITCVWAHCCGFQVEPQTLLILLWNHYSSRGNITCPSCPMAQLHIAVYRCIANGAFLPIMHLGLHFK